MTIAMKWGVTPLISILPVHIHDSDDVERAMAAEMEFGLQEAPKKQNMVVFARKNTGLIHRMGMIV